MSRAARPTTSLLGKPTPAPAPVDPWPATLRIINAATAAGTHDSVARSVCGNCRQWCNGHFYHATGSGGGIAGSKWLCYACWAALFPVQAQAFKDREAAEARRAFAGQHVYSGDPT